MAVKTTDEKRAAIIAALLTGQGVMEVAKQYKVSHQTVGRIKASISQGALDEVGRKKREIFGDLIAHYLEESLTTLSIQQQHFRDKKWLISQSAAELGTLHGITADKTIRILEALEAANPEDE